MQELLAVFNIIEVQYGLNELQSEKSSQVLFPKTRWLSLAPGIQAKPIFEQVSESFIRLSSEASLEFNFSFGQKCNSVKTFWQPLLQTYKIPSKVTLEKF